MGSLLVLGANRGIGLGLTAEFLERGWRVIATARDPRKADALQSLAGRNRDRLAIHALDVTDDAGVHALAEELAWDSIDLFVHNAGIYGPRMTGPEAVDSQVWMDVLRVNTVAPYQTALAFLPHIARGKGKKMCFLTSRMGSIEDNTSGGSYVYRSSKAGLNAVVKSLAVDLKPRGIVAAMLHPGWVATDMGGEAAPLGVEESTKGLADVMVGLKPEQSGAFLDWSGAAIPW